MFFLVEGLHAPFPSTLLSIELEIVNAHTNKGAIQEVAKFNFGRAEDPEVLSFGMMYQLVRRKGIQYTVP